ncbi:hypothetical protein ACF044_00985 [Microbacterium sp. NPDC016588]|jgi:hypothetical protein|nr:MULTISPECIES: hypothetical protein [Microbacterium]MDI9890010.1 hypothetical protein [Microbacterium sp. IEGM 1404]
MSGETTPETETPSKPLIALLTPPADDDAPAASRCCGGGSCSLN